MTEEINLHGELIDKAKLILMENWVDLGRGHGFTKPARCLYPFQWSWDSAFIAMGYAHYDPERAKQELRSLFSAQWGNGFIPQIVFHEIPDIVAGEYFPGADIWQSERSKYAPKDISTSGISQPAVHAWAVWRIYKKILQHDQVEAEMWLREMYPKLLAFHNYLYTVRDPEGWGLITIFHPWESGLDNSPRWDKAQQRVSALDMSQFKRLDLECVDPTRRPSDEEYGRYMKLLEDLRDADYDHQAIYDSYPFKVKDIVFSCLTHVSNCCLLEMADIIGEDKTEINTWKERFARGIVEHCWDEEEGLFFDVDIISGEQIKIHTVACLTPLLADDLSFVHYVSLLEYLTQESFCGTGECAYRLAPSTARHEESYNHELYWRGPIWINANWLICRALQNLGERERAEIMRNEFLRLIVERGFWEYFSAETGEGIGGQNFSWSAALTIDLLME